jgi:TonB family protein
MYNESRLYEDVETLNFKLPLDRNTTIGFCIGTPLVLGVIALLFFWEDIDPEPRAIKYNVAPLTILNFGDGDGTGMSKGNLSAEGAAHKGQNPASDLHDAEIATQTRTAKSNAETDASVSNNIVSVADIGSANKNNDAKAGSSSQNVGLADGSLDGTGLGSRGRGMGLGEGFGDIEWGGGGNRIVLSKKPPKFPRNVNTSGEIRIRFRVRPDGTVSAMIPLQKSDPAFERAALEALRQWRFNPIKDTIEMEGIIPFKFRLK